VIIDASYFTGSIFLPQVGTGASNIANNDKKLQDAIDKYGAEILVKGMGRKLANEFLAQFDSNGLIGGADEKWDNLLNGTEYTIEGEDKIWRGLIDITGSLKESLIAYYTYFHYARESDSVMTVMGIKKGKSQNTTGADPSKKLVDAWLSFHRWYCVDSSNDVSLNTFLSENPIDYPGRTYVPVGTINRFGI
jgi:hypothetical protein